MADAPTPTPLTEGGAAYHLPGVVTPFSPEKAFPDPTVSRETPEPVDGNTRANYAAALGAGTTLGPQDYHDAHHAAGLNPNPDLASQLPSTQDLIDSSIETLRRNSMPADPAMVNMVQQNLADHWAATGQHPAVAIQDPETRDAMARTPLPAAPLQQLGNIVQHLETGGMENPDDAVSPSGAVGRNQILPSTAKQYGFDPARLHDASYNNMARDAILSDLSSRFHGETAAVLIGYNAGPGVADKWIASGRDTSILPEETQKYLANAARQDGGMTMARGSTTYDPGANVTFTEKVQTAAADFAQQFRDYAEQQGEAESEALKSGDLGKYLKSLPPDEMETAENTAINFTPLGVGSLAGEALRAVFSTPAELAAHAESTAGRDWAQAAIRAEGGAERRFTAAASEALESFRATVNKGIPEYQAWLAQHPGVGVPMWNKDTPPIAYLIDHMEGGAGGGKLPADHPLLPVANAIRDIYQATRKEIETNISSTMGFYTDYYRHLWKDPAAADRVMGVARSGSSASLNLRTIPTIMEGIQKGLTPRFLDPIENALHYVAGMRKFITFDRVFTKGRDAGWIKYGDPGVAPQPGWVPLVGRSATIVNPGTGQMMRAYAPAGFAQSYNSYFGRGFYDWQWVADHPGAGKIYDNLNRAANLSTAMKLSLSGYHAWNIAQESVIAGVANAIGEISHGELARGMADLGLSVTVLPHLARAYRRGTAITDAYLHQGGTALDEELARLITKAGGRVVGRGAEMGYRQADNWFTAFHRGSLAQELKVGFVHIIGDMSEPTARRVALGLPRAGAYFGHELGRAVSTMTAPLFDHIIPRLKTAAFGDEMAAWLRQNAGASEQATVAHARQLVDSMDNRFGEMVQDNLFWNRSLKQALNLASISVSWEYGTLRAFGTGARDLLNGNTLSPHARWLMAFPVVMGLSSAVYQYLKMGLLGPSAETPGKDMILPRTGGTTPEGAPQRALLPGYLKDPIQWFNTMQELPSPFAAPAAAAGLIANKLNPLAGVLKGTITGTDWQGNPIYSGFDPKTGEQVPGWKAYLNFVEGELAPIAAQQPRLRGTNISWPERIMGIRPAPEAEQNPARVETAREKEQRWQTRQQLRRMQRQRSRLENPDE